MRKKKLSFIFTMSFYSNILIRSIFFLKFNLSVLNSNSHFYSIYIFILKSLYQYKFQVEFTIDEFNLLYRYFKDFPQNVRFGMTLMGALQNFFLFQIIKNKNRGIFFKQETIVVFLNRKNKRYLFKIEDLLKRMVGISSWVK